MGENELGISDYTGIFFKDKFMKEYHRDISSNGFDDSMDKIRVIDKNKIEEENALIFNRLNDDELKSIRESKLIEVLADGYFVEGCIANSNLKREFKLFKGHGESKSLFVEFYKEGEIFSLNKDMLLEQDIAWVVDEE